MLHVVEYHWLAPASVAFQSNAVIVVSQGVIILVYEIIVISSIVTVTLTRAPKDTGNHLDYRQYQYSNDQGSIDGDQTAQVT